MLEKIEPVRIELKYPKDIINEVKNQGYDLEYRKALKWLNAIGVRKRSPINYTDFEKGVKYLKDRYIETLRSKERRKKEDKTTIKKCYKEWTRQGLLSVQYETLRRWCVELGIAPKGGLAKEEAENLRKYAIVKSRAKRHISFSSSEGRLKLLSKLEIEAQFQGVMSGREFLNLCIEYDAISVGSVYNRARKKGKVFSTKNIYTSKELKEILV